jgi:Family of unknown function (DUF6717)
MGAAARTLNVDGERAVASFEAMIGMENSIFVIKPYKWEGLWVFDDPAVGLVREPFVGGADRMIDHATKAIPNADRGFVALFSTAYFPEAKIILDWVRAEGGGNVYRWSTEDMEGWFCPALNRYFRRAPKKLYVQVKAAVTRQA